MGGGRREHPADERQKVGLKKSTVHVVRENKEREAPAPLGNYILDMMCCESAIFVNHTFSIHMHL